MNARAAGRRNPVILLLLPCWLDIFSIRPPPSLYLLGDTIIFLGAIASNTLNQIRHLYFFYFSLPKKRAAFIPSSFFQATVPVSHHHDYWQRYGTNKTREERREREGANQVEIYVKTPRDAVVGFCGTRARNNQTTTSLSLFRFYNGRYLLSRIHHRDS